MLNSEVKMCSHEIESTINSSRGEFRSYSLFDNVFVEQCLSKHLLILK